MDRTRKQRILTGFVLVVAVVLAVFAAPPEVFFLLCLGVFVGGAAELVKILRFWTPRAPLGMLLALLPATAGALAYLLRQDAVHPLALAAVPAGIVLASALAVLWSAAPMPEAAVAIGFLSFAAPYFALPAASLYGLHRMDPWLVLALVALVALGDTAAYFIGSWIGRHRLAPTVSPKKSWEGSVAGVAAAVLTMAAWCLARRGELEPAWLALAAVTSVAAQLGDLVESLVKRGAGVKDSSDILPGHGGIYDRIDAMLFAAPVFLLGLWALGLEP